MIHFLFVLTVVILVIAMFSGGLGGVVQAGLILLIFWFVVGVISLVAHVNSDMDCFSGYEPECPSGSHPGAEGGFDSALTMPDNSHVPAKEERMNVNSSPEDRPTKAEADHNEAYEGRVIDLDAWRRERGLPFVPDPWGGA